MVSKEDIQKEHIYLKETIRFHNNKYHSEDNPEISDQEFDQLFKQLKELEKKYNFLDISDSPSNLVGAIKLSELSSFEHLIPMLSLDNAFSEEDLSDFEKRNQNKIKEKVNFSYLVEPKIDGVAISLFYKKGILTKAGTRGDGVVGEEVTHNIKTISEIPKSLKNNFPDEIEIRGEIFVELNDFKKINQNFEKRGQKVFANPRNFVAGSIRQLDSKIALERPLKVFCHSVGFISKGNFFNTQKEMISKFKDWGLPVSDEIYFCENLDKVNRQILKMTAKREKLNYEIDGIVVKINDKSLQERLGNSSRSPRWAIAKKFLAEQGETEILSISFQMGRTGVLTPVANLKPVKLGGVTISNATLHNMDEVKRLDVRVGDYVKIIRAGDVIPKVTEVILKKRKPNRKKIIMPSSCPTCSNPVSFFELNTPLLDTSLLSTTNKNCFGFSQFKETLKHFVSRNAMDIDGLGQRTIDLFIEKEFIKSLPDLFKITSENILSLEGFADKSTKKLLESIKSSLKTDLYRFIYALGIKEIGLETSKNLSNFFTSLDKLSKASYDDFISVNDVGEVAASNLEKFFSNEKNLSLIQELVKLGLDLKPPVSVKTSHLTDKTIVITGRLSGYSRETLKFKLEGLGAKISNSVSKKTDFLIAGEDSGSKLQKAKEYDVKIVTDSNLEKFISNS